MANTEDKTPAIPINPELTIIPPEAGNDEYAGGTVMPLPDDAAPAAPAAATAPAATAPAAPSDGADDIDWPFFMSPELSRSEMLNLQQQALLHDRDIDDMIAAYQAERRKLVLEMQQQAQMLHDSIQDRKRERGNIINLSSRRDDQHQPPWYGITLACLLHPIAPPDPNNPSAASVAARSRALISTFNYSRAQTPDGGRLQAFENRLVVRKGSEQAVALLLEEAKARGWTSLEASGTKEFCTKLCQLAQQHNIKVVAYPNFPGNMLRRPMRYDPVPTEPQRPNKEGPALRRGQQARTPQEEDRTAKRNGPRLFTNTDPALDPAGNKRRAEAEDIDHEGEVRRIQGLKEEREAREQLDSGTQDDDFNPQP